MNGPRAAGGDTRNYSSHGGRVFVERPTSSSSSPERSPLRHTIRRSQSATLTIGGAMPAFKDLTIRTVPPDSDDDDSRQQSPSTPPRTPTNRSVHGFDFINEVPEPHTPHSEPYTPAPSRIAPTPPTHEFSTPVHEYPRREDSKSSHHSSIKRAKLQRPKLKPQTSLKSLRHEPVDAAQVLEMMKESRGRMEGVLEFRTDNMAWVKGYCTINEDTGHLLHVREDRTQQSIIGDLRGCQIRTGEDDIIEISTHSSRHDVKIRPGAAYNHWLAALLCWQPIKPAGPNNKMVKSQVVRLNERKFDRRRNSDASVVKDAAIIKVGKMMLWDRTSPPIVVKASRHHKTPIPGWKKISCILQENGEFKLYNEHDVALLCVIQLSTLSRCAIQHLDPTVLGLDFCIAIYPQYTPATSFSTLYPQNPVCLAVDSRMLYEVWFVLLRAYTVPEMYGPAGSTTASPRSSVKETLTDAFRVPRSLSVRIIEAKQTSIDHHDKHMEVYIEIFIDGEVRARTMPRLKSPNVFWLEQFEFNELPAQLENIEFVLMQRTLKHKNHRHHPSNNSNIAEMIGKLDVRFHEMKFDTETESWWPLMRDDETVGEVMLKLRKEELVVLMNEEYRPIVDLLLDFPNALTIEIGQIVSTDIRRLAHTLLKILQVNGKAAEWLMSLAEAEIDGIQREHGRHRANSNESEDARPTLTEANILFRGNTLLTKALEAHMKRFGREYLEETVGEHVKKIVDDEYYCEVDPSRLKSGDDLKHQWKILLILVKSMWQSIYRSAAKCPLEIRKILHHIRKCVEERYDVKSVSYSSVSGFLFLRFFCPGVLNPKLFGLIKDHPGHQAQRTLTLITKSLQGLANMTVFGIKEPWMENMNEFLNNHSKEFKDFIDQITTVSTSPQLNSVPPSYATPITILARLSQASKEGFPSLPFLIDQPRALSRLVTMWLKWFEVQSNRNALNLQGDLLHFHEICLYIKDRMAICVERAENAERPSSSLSSKWEEVAESVTGTPLFQNSSYNTLQSYSSKHSMRSGSGRNGSTASVLEEEPEYLTAGVAAVGKSKLSELVVGIKRRVRKGAEGE